MQHLRPGGHCGGVRSVDVDRRLHRERQVMEMAWCASTKLNLFGACRWRFECGVLPRCAFCPLFDAPNTVFD
ncbi:MAG TPA: hypothetical protein VF327_07310, partial [Gaiellaceae bacterium]